MKTDRSVGIAGFGGYVPRFRIQTKHIAEAWRSKSTTELPVSETSVPGPDEDTITMSIEAARLALRRSGVLPSEIGGIWLGSESNPYAAKPGATLVAAALGLRHQILAADVQFACKAASEAMQTAIAAVGSGMVTAGLAIGMDVAQARPGDVLEQTAGCGGAAFLIGPASRSLAVVDGSVSYVSDTPDFFRRDGMAYPQHTGRFTEQPGYYRHTMAAARQLLEELRLEPQDFDHAVFHQPHPKLVKRVAQSLGFTPRQIEHGMCVPYIGDAYAGSAVLGLAAVLDVAQPGQRILFCSYGSGAGSDAIAFRITEAILSRRDANTVARHLARREFIDYGTYLRYTGRIRT